MSMIVNKIKSLTLNVRSLRKHYDDLLTFLHQQTSEYDIIILTEIWIYEYEVYRYHLSGFTFQSQCKNNERSIVTEHTLLKEF